MPADPLLSSKLGESSSNMKDSVSMESKDQELVARAVILDTTKTPGDDDENKTHASAAATAVFAATATPGEESKAQASAAPAVLASTTTSGDENKAQPSAAPGTVLASTTPGDENKAQASAAPGTVLASTTPGDENKAQASAAPGTVLASTTPGDEKAQPLAAPAAVLAATTTPGHEWTFAAAAVDLEAATAGVSNTDPLRLPLLTVRTSAPRFRCCWGCIGSCPRFSLPNLCRRGCWACDCLRIPTGRRCCGWFFRPARTLPTDVGHASREAGIMAKHQILLGIALSTPLVLLTSARATHIFPAQHGIWIAGVSLIVWIFVSCGMLLNLHGQTSLGLRFARHVSRLGMLSLTVLLCFYCFFAFFPTASWLLWSAVGLATAAHCGSWIMSCVRSDED